MKVYVLLHSSAYDEESSSCIEAVGSEAAMLQKLAEAKKATLEDYKVELESDDYEVTESKNSFEIENVAGKIDYVRYIVSEHVYEDVTDNKGYIIEYEPRFGYAMIFDSEIQNKLEALQKDEDAWDEFCDKLTENRYHEIEDYGADMVSFHRSVGCNDFDPSGFTEGDIVKIPAEVQSLAEEIMAIVRAAIDKGVQ